MASIPVSSGNAAIAVAEPSAHTGWKPANHAARQVSTPSPMCSPSVTSSSIEFDGSTAGTAELLTPELGTSLVEKCAMDSARHIGPNVSEERHHARHECAIELKGRMKPDNIDGNAIGQRERAGREIAADHSSARITRLVPKPQRACRAGIRILFHRGAVRPSHEGLPVGSPLSRAEPKCNSHMLSTFTYRVTRERMDDKA